MLDTYRKLEANGAIGKMMKVASDGTPIFDPSGEKPGNLVARPFVEFPKVVRRYRDVVDPASGKTLTRCFETIVNSKSEELRVIAEQPDEIGVPLSPLERERNELANMNAEKDKAINALEQQMAAMMAQVSALATKVDQTKAEEVALGHQPSAAGKGIEALALSGLALSGKSS